jgi:integrase
MSALPLIATVKADIALWDANSSRQQQRSTIHAKDANLSIPTTKRAPWNKGRLIGAKPPLQQKHVWAIRGMLQNERNKRDLAMFNLAIDSKLRGCDVVTIKVDDIAPNGYAINRATVRQRKTRRPVRFELTEHTRQAVDDYLKFSRKKLGEFLFTGHRCGRCPRHSGAGRRLNVRGKQKCSALHRDVQVANSVAFGGKADMAFCTAYVRF